MLPAWSLANLRVPIQVVPRIARAAEGAVKGSPEAKQEGPRPFPDGGPLRGRALLQGGAAIPGDDGSQQDCAEGEADGRGQRRISSGLCIGTWRGGGNATGETVGGNGDRAGSAAVDVAGAGVHVRAVFPDGE